MHYCVNRYKGILCLSMSTRTKQKSTVPSIAIGIDTSTSWGRGLIAGILEYAQQHGPWHIHIKPHDRSNDLNLPQEFHGDGLIARISSSEMVQKINKLEIPAVNLSGIHLAKCPYPRVVTSVPSTVKLAVDLFRSKGFRNFAFVGSLEKKQTLGYLLEYKKQLAHFGADCLVKDQPEEQRLFPWLRTLPKPVAILCRESTMGHEIIDSCFSAKINVPGDIAVLATDYDDLLSEASQPPLAGVRIATHQIGMTAAAILDGMMNGRRPERKEWEIDPLGIAERLSVDTFAVEDKRMAAVMRFLHQHALESITVEDVLHANPMSRRTLERKFHLLFGCSIVKQIRLFRINHVRALLAETNKPITLIAEECGFSSYNYLNRVFRSETGYSPSQYRKESQTPTRSPQP